MPRFRLLPDKSTAMLRWQAPPPDQLMPPGSHPVLIGDPGNYRTIEVLVNPTLSQVVQLINDSEYKEVRALRDIQTDNLFVWESSSSIHSDIARAFYNDKSFFPRVVDTATWTLGIVSGSPVALEWLRRSVHPA